MTPAALRHLREPRFAVHRPARLEHSKPQSPGPQRIEQPETAVVERVRARPPRMFRVILHNDDFTTMEFVVWVLVQIFDKTAAEATRLMLQVHQQGAAQAGLYPRQVAETKCSETLALAEEQGMPLLVTIEPESDDNESSSG